MKWTAIVLGAAAALGHVSAAKADVIGAAPDGFALRFEASSTLDRDALWARALSISQWWSGAHTYSGDAANLSLDPVPGGCWCERWDGGAVEHGRVIALLDGALLRVEAPFGPLQGMGVTAILSLTFRDVEDEAEGGTLVSVDFVASGSSAAGLDGLAPAVDRVVGEQVARLVAGDEDQGESESESESEPESDGDE